MNEQKNASLNGPCSDRQMQTGLIQQLATNNGVIQVPDNRIIPLLQQIDQKLDLLLGCLVSRNQNQSGVSAGRGEFVLRTKEENLSD